MSDPYEMGYSATYDPSDNKLRLRAFSRLDKETYTRVRSAGFIWAPKQDLFVAPAWTPEREDLLLEMAGEIEDEDTTLAERAETRADRFTDYSANRADDAERARKAVSDIADNIPLGQPILVGHHSEKRARKDAEKIENGMRKTVKMWEQSQYWKSRAAGAIHHAKYKEQPAVRARRIKGIEADKRKREKEQAEAAKLLRFWSQENITREKALQVSNYFDHAGITLPSGEACWSLWSALDREQITVEQARAERLEGLPKRIAYLDRWLLHYNNRLDYERAMLAEDGGLVTDRTGPEKGGGCRCWASPRGGWSYVVKVNRVSVSVEDNWGNGGQNFNRTIPFDKLAGVMTKAEVDAARAGGLLLESANKTGFFITESKPPEEPPRYDSTPIRPENAEIDAMRETLKAGVKVVSVPQLFPTPADLAAKMVILAEIEPQHRVLEPSAGTGALIREIVTYARDITAIEFNLSLATELDRRAADQFHGADVQVKCLDFLECNGDLGKFDRIVMNPPFANAQDIEHIRHAFGMLAPGGRLVAICANGPRQQNDLRPLVEASGGTWEELPADTFKDSGTCVNTVLLTMEG